MPKINIKFLMFSTIIFIVGYFIGREFFLSILYAICIIVVLSLIDILIASKFVKMSINMERKKYFVGETLKFKTLLINKGVLPIPYLLVTSEVLRKFDKNYNGIGISLYPFNKVNAESKAYLPKRGIYDIGITILEFNDLFYIFTKKKRIFLYSEINVYPRIFDLKGSISMVHFNYDYYKVNDRSSNEDVTLIKDIRQYNNGDSMKKIHWKVSAKHNELYVKNFENTYNPQLVCFLNMNNEQSETYKNANVEETVIDFCASVQSYCLRKNVKSKLYINNEISVEMKIENSNNFEEMMEYFLNNESKGKNEFSNFIKDKITFSGKKDPVFVISQFISEKTAQEISKLAFQYNLYVFYYFCDNNVQMIFNKYNISCICIPNILR